MPLFATESLTKVYDGRVTALTDLTVQVQPGIVGLVGSNGAGKSTLIKILLGLLPPTGGRVQVLDRDPTEDAAAVRSRVGYLPEHDCLPPDLTAAELITHLGRVSGLPRTIARERASEALRHVGLYEERYRAIGGYSTGMRQRVKLAQALVHDPTLIFLDEPTNGLDPRGRDDMLELIRRIGTEFGLSVLVTSHLLGELERICDHVIVIDGGRLLRSSATAEFTRATALLSVEVTDSTDELGVDLLGRELAAKGLRVQSHGHVLSVELADETTFDLIRDTTAELNLGLVRMQRGRHRIEELFRTQHESEGEPHVASA